MKVNVVIFVNIVMTILLVSCQRERADASPVSDHKIPDLLVKRSLCNTFGGCGTKRSLSVESQEPIVEIVDHFQSDNQYDPTLGNDIYKEGRVNSKTVNKNEAILAEVLEHLMEYLKKSQKLNEGKYTIYVPRRLTNEPTNPMESALGAGILESASGA